MNFHYHLFRKVNLLSFDSTHKILIGNFCSHYWKNIHYIHYESIVMWEFYWTVYDLSQIFSLNLKKENGVSMNANFIWDALRDLVPFAQFRKRGKHLWRSDNYSQLATLLKITLVHGWFLSFVNCTKSRKASLFWKCKKQLHNTFCFAISSVEQVRLENEIVWGT